MIEQFREAIRQDGRSLYKLVQESDVIDAQLSRFMTGKRSLSGPAIDKLCRVLGLSLVQTATSTPGSPSEPKRPRTAKKPTA